MAKEPKGLDQFPVVDIEAIPKHMDFSSLVSGGDFHTGKESDIVPVDGVVETGYPVNGIMVREGGILHSRPPHSLPQGFRRELPVAQRGMAMEVDAGSGFH